MGKWRYFNCKTPAAAEDYLVPERMQEYHYIDAGIVPDEKI